MRRVLILGAILLLFYMAPGSAKAPSEEGLRGEETFRYHTLDEVWQVVHEVAREWEVARVVNSTSFGIEGEEILSVVIGNNSTAPALLVVGAHHGDEPVSGEIPLYFLLYLKDGWERGNSTIRYLLEHTRVVVVPVLNPWGFRYGMRWDSEGQDINRDYPYDPSPAGENSDGVPLSTAGAQFMDALFREYSPELALSFHSGRRFIIYPWGCSAHQGRSPDHAIFEEVGKSLAGVASGVGGEMSSLQANTAPGVSYIRGTWLDWAYAASWDLRNTRGPPLPASALSFTVEISEEKAPEEGLLGSWNELEAGGGGYVSQGVRICLKALHLTTPGIEVAGSGRGWIRIRVHGDPSPSEPQLITVDPPGVVEYSYTREEGLLGIEYNMTFDPALSGTFVVRVPFGDYLFENGSAMSAFYGRRLSGYMSTPPLKLGEPPTPPPPQIHAEVLGEAEAAGCVEVSIEGVENFTLIRAVLTLGGEEYNLTSGAEVVVGGLRLHLPPASGNGTLSLEILSEGDTVRFVMPVNVTPSVHLGGVPGRIPAGRGVTVVPYVYGTPPQNTAEISLHFGGEVIEVLTCQLFTPVNLTAPFALGNITLTVTCGPFSRNYTVELTYAVHTVVTGVDLNGGLLKIGPVFISAPGPAYVDPEEVRVVAIIVDEEGEEVERVNLTFSEELQPDFNDPLLPPGPGGFYTEMPWKRGGSYRVFLSISYPGGSERVEAGGFVAPAEEDVVRDLFRTIAVAIIISLVTLTAFLLHQIRVIKRSGGLREGGERS